MRLHTAADLLDGEHRSQVDQVRITPRPPYARTATWFHWASPGGWVWVFVWLWIVILLFLFYIFTDYGQPPGEGIPYGFGGPHLNEVHIQELLGGQPVRDDSGKVLLDPGGTRVTLFSLDSAGRLEVLYRSNPGVGEEPGVMIVIPARECEYRHVIDALDRIHMDLLEIPANPYRVWLAAPQ